MNFKLFSHRSLLAVICAGTLLASAPSAQAFSLPDKKYWVPIILAFTAYGRLVTKDEPDKNPLNMQTAFEGIIKPSARKLSLWEHIVKSIDDVVIGFQGKKAGLRVFGSKVIVEGHIKPEFTTNHIYPNGEEAKFFMRHNAAPYGIMGIAYANIMCVLKGLKDVKEANETLSYFEIKIYEPAKK